MGTYKSKGTDLLRLTQTGSLLFLLATMVLPPAHSTQESNVARSAGGRHCVEGRSEAQIRYRVEAIIRSTIDRGYFETKVGRVWTMAEFSSAVNNGFLG